MNFLDVDPDADIYRITNAKYFLAHPVTVSTRPKEFGHQVGWDARDRSFDKRVIRLPLSTRKTTASRNKISPLVGVTERQACITAVLRRE